MLRKIWLIGLLALGLPAGVWGADANGPSLQGTFYSNEVSGQHSGRGHGWMEVPIYAQALNQGVGAGVRTGHSPAGGFTLPDANSALPRLGAGPAALYGLSYFDIPAFSIRRNVTLGAAAGPVKADLRSPAHYSVMYNVHPDEWGESPYSGDGVDFHQTFVATSPHVTRVAVKLAGKGGDHDILTLHYAIVEPNAGPPSSWKRISPIRTRVFDKGVDPIIHIYHVVYRSSEVKLEVGKTYAVRFWRDPGSPSPNFVLACREDKGDGYRGGMLYRDGVALPDQDAYAYVSGGEPGTITNHAPVESLDLKDYSGATKVFGQTFKATGRGLAAADIVYADGQALPVSLPVRFQLFDKPGGTAIGPSKTCYGVPLTYQGRAAVVWDKGEVNLKPGTMYYLEWTVPTDVNSWVLNEDLPGSAWLDREEKPDIDMAMSIVEYE